jgi:hypothetical protein
MMKGFVAALSFISTAAWAQHALAPPQVGFIQVGFLGDSRREIRPVIGLAGNFLVGRAASTGIVSAAFSGSFGMLKSDSAITVIDQHGRAMARADAPPGPALFAFSENGSPALVYLEKSKTLRVWNGRQFQPDIDETVLSIASLSSTRGALIVQRENGLWRLGVELATGAIVSQMALPGVIAPVLMLPGGGIVYRDAHEVAVRREDGSEKRIAAHLPVSLGFGQMGNGWVQVTDLASGRVFAVNVQPGHERFYFLPEARQ